MSRNLIPTLLSAAVVTGHLLAIGPVDASVSGSTTIVADTTTAAPDNNGSFSTFRFLRLNDAGQAMFLSSMTGTNGGSSDDSGIFHGDGTTLTQVARTGQAAPDNNGSFVDFFRIAAFNDAGQAGFLGFFSGTSGGASDDSGIFRGDGTTLTQIARKGQAAPENNGSFAGSSSPTLNDAGQVAFSGSITGTSGGGATTAAFSAETERS